MKTTIATSLLLGSISGAAAADRFEGDYLRDCGPVACNLVVERISPVEYRLLFSATGPLMGDRPVCSFETTATRQDIVHGGQVARDVLAGKFRGHSVLVGGLEDGVSVQVFLAEAACPGLRANGAYTVWMDE